MRCADVFMVRKFIGGNESCNHRIAAFFTRLKKSGVIDGKVAGKDYKGYDFKRWTLVDPVKAKQLLSERHIRPMRADAIKFGKVE